MIETILLNFLFLLFPVIIALVFFEDKLTSLNKYLIVVLSAVTLVLCMAFPIKLDLGFIIDLRFIPFIIIALFGGYKMVFPLYLVLNGYRFIIGGEGTYQSLIFSTVIFILVPLLSKKFSQQSSRGRILYALFAGVFTTSLYYFALGFNYQKLTSEFWLLTFSSFVVNIIAIFIIMSLIEKIITNVKTREIYLRSERLNDISDLSASIAHEIRNPLTVTSGFLQLLKGSKTISPDEKTYIEFSLQELERAEKIVSDFLTFSKPQCANMVYSDFKKEIEYVENIMKPYAKMNQVEIQVSFTNTLKKSYDENQIQQCFINLFKNGIEAMKENGGGSLYVDVSEQKDHIAIVIKDSGIGMTSEEISQLGKPYYSTKKEGTGLGMLMIYSTIRNVKGDIKVESIVGKGTTFLITIPV
ncbi:ATP-binding protein [Sporosarcina sp. JAI121]|uniref:ATP-binding protein n=1 Tax=Sporosarcina sp. JAI121 TaxID=2723064 RepID=UPI0015C8E089|nr:ATP-binding protein [Sporosarcina sp. JAI121]NYF24994.1 two-component system sporulation sensor kinase B [Sporosarcina sp. JAI121]